MVWPVQEDKWMMEELRCKTVREWNIKVMESDNLPVSGVCSIWDDGEYRIFIKEGLSDREKLQIFIHEMIHLYNNDLDYDDVIPSVQAIEARTHRAEKEILKKTVC